MKPDEILHDKLESLVPDLQLDVPAENLIKRGRRIRAARQSLIASGAAVAVAGITVAITRAPFKRLPTAAANFSRPT
jgi:hypothetical protein